MSAKIFYRYYRPVRFDHQRAENVNEPRGGICLRFETTADCKWAITHSRCSENDVFSRDVARQIADKRSLILTRTRDERVIIDPVQCVHKQLDAVQVAIANWTAEEDTSLSPAFKEYLAIEYSELQKCIAKIKYTTEQATKVGEVFKLHLAALQYNKFYENQNRTHS